MVDVIGGILIVMVMLWIFGLCYKKRARISMWLEDPGMMLDTSPEYTIRRLRRMAVASRR